MATINILRTHTDAHLTDMIAELGPKLAGHKEQVNLITLEIKRLNNELSRRQK